MLVGVIISSIVYRLKTYTKRVNDLKIEQLKIKNEKESDSIFSNGDLTIDFSAHTFKLLDREIKLTNYEYKILTLLAKNVGKTLTHNYIISKIWGPSGNDANTLRVFVSGIRRKIEKTAMSWVLINKTPAGRGTDTLRNANGIYFPIIYKDKLEGLIGFKCQNIKFKMIERILLQQILPTIGLAITLLNNKQV